MASVPQREQFPSTPESSLPKRKGNRVICPKHQILSWERVKVSENHTFTREGRSEWEHREEKVDSTMKEGKFQGGK